MQVICVVLFQFQAVLKRLTPDSPRSVRSNKRDAARVISPVAGIRGQSVGPSHVNLPVLQREEGEAAVDTLRLPYK